jgi:hypothetical protein
MKFEAALGHEATLGHRMTLAHRLIASDSSSRILTAFSQGALQRNEKIAPSVNDAHQERDAAKTKAPQAYTSL